MVAVKPTIESSQACSQIAKQSTVDPAQLRVRQIELQDVDAAFLSEWEALEYCTLEGNAFLSPHFILPSLKHLTPDVEPIIIVVEFVEDTVPRLVGLGVFEEVGGNTHLPLPHLRAYKSIHTFFDGLLIDASCSIATMQAFFGFLLEQSQRWHGVESGNRSGDSPFSRQLEATASTMGICWIGDSEHERAAIKPAQVTPDYLTEHFAKNRRKALKRSRRFLEESGQFKSRQVRSASESERCTNTFLDLEQMGWKGEQGTALASNQNESDFFRELVAGFAQTRRALFVELSVDEEYVASAISLISGNTAFAFKIGYHTGYSEGSPGTLANLEMLASARREYRDLELFDSCSVPDAAISKIWPWRRKITSGLFITSTRGSLLATPLSHARKFKRKLGKLRFRQ